MKKTRGLLIALVMLLMLCSVALAEAPAAAVVGEFNGEALTFADFSNVGTSQWQENEGVISVVDHSQHAYLRLDKLLGNDYTIDFDFKKEDAGFNNVFIGFGIKDGHANLTESGYSLNLIAGFARVMRYENYNELFGNHFDGDVNMAAFLDWTHIQIACKDGKDYTITFNDGTERKIEFTDETFPGGYFVLSAYGNTPCYYKNIKVTTTEPAAPVEEPAAEEAAPAAVVGEFNGEALTFADFSNVGTSQWQENEGVISVVDHSQHAYLRLDKLLGNDYTIDFDFKKEDAGFNNVFIGFGIKDGHANLTESGYSLNLIAGFARVMRYENYNELFGNHFDGDVNMAAFLDWTHIQIACKDGKDYTITFNDGTERKIEFTDETFPGGYFVLSAYGSTPCYYKNIKVTTEVEEEVSSNGVVGTYNGEPLYLSEFSNCAFGSWSYADGIVTAEELSDFTLLRLEKNLGSTYTIEYDVKQEDTTSGWQTIMAGFDCKEGKNLTESGYVLDMHNAGVARVIVYGKANAGAAHAGSYENPFGGNAAYAAPTDWIHVKIERVKNDFTITINDGEEKMLTFTDDTQNGGYLCLGAVGNRKISYKDIVITSTEEITIEEEKPRVRAVSLEKNAGLGNTFNGEPITFSDWVQLDEDFAWDEQNGIMSPVELGDWASIGFNKALGDTYTIELDVKQYDISTGWNTVMIGFDVNEGESLFTSGLTLDMHNAGVWRIIDWKNANNNDVPMGNYNNPFGGTLPYTCTTQWQHVKITREGSFYTVTLDDGNPQMTSFETDQFNGGHLVIAAVGTRDVMFKNIHIKDYVEVDLGEVIYPEEVGSTTYTFNGNQYGEWLTTNASAWEASGKDFTQKLTEGEQTAYLDTEPVRNFRLEMDYEVMSENGGTFGVGFRKKNGAGSYKNLGYSLIFNMADRKNRLTFADYTASSAAGIDGKVHSFELAGHLVLECSGNQVHIWLDDELIVNAKDNSYAYGLLSLYTENCSVTFSNIKITSDYLTTDSCKQIVETASVAENVTEEVIAEYDALSAFQKSFVDTKTQQTIEDIRTKLANAWIPYAVGGGALAIIVIAAVAVLLKKKGKKAKNP